MSEDAPVQEKQKLKKLGGKMFPRVPLGDSAEHARKLYSKTMSGPQPDSIIYKGVFGSSTDMGAIRASAARQYGFLTGTAAALQATDLAKQVAVSAPGNLQKHLREAFLRPPIFKALHATFTGDNVTKARLKEQAGQLGVHLETADRCVDVFCESLIYAGLGTVENESVSIVPQTPSVEPADQSDGSESETGEISTGETEIPEVPQSGRNGKPSGDAVDSAQIHQLGHSTRSIVNVNINIDSTMDTEKLERQLGLLRKYGAI